MPKKSYANKKAKLSELLEYVGNVKGLLESATPSDKKLNSEKAEALENRKREIHKSVEELYTNILCLEAYFPKTKEEKKKSELSDFLRKNTDIYDTLREQNPAYRGKTNEEIYVIASHAVGGWGLAIETQVKREMNRLGVHRR